MKQKKQSNPPKEIEDLKVGWQRTQADFDNFRKRVESEKQDWRQLSQMEFALELLPVVDNFERALSHLTDVQKADATIQGILHIQKQLNGVLENLGVKKMIVNPGDSFDHNLHEAVDSHENQGGDIIDAIHQDGYLMGDKVLRPAKVVVKNQ